MPSYRVGYTNLVVVFTGDSAVAVTELIAALEGQNSAIMDLNIEQLLGLGRQEAQTLGQLQPLAVGETVILANEDASAINSFLYGIRGNQAVFERSGLALDEEHWPTLASLHEELALTPASMH